MGWGLWRTPEPRPFVCERHRDSHHERCGPSCGTGSESCSPPASELHWLPSQPRPSNARLAPTAPRSEWRPGHANKPEHLPHAGRGARAAPGRHLGEASGVRHRGPTNCRCCRPAVAAGCVTSLLDACLLGPRGAWLWNPASHCNMRARSLARPAICRSEGSGLSVKPPLGYCNPPWVFAERRPGVPHESP